MERGQSRNFWNRAELIRTFFVNSPVLCFIFKHVGMIFDEKTKALEPWGPVPTSSKFRDEQSLGGLQGGEFLT